MEFKKKNETGLTASILREKKIQNTQEIKRTLFDWTKKDNTCTFLKKSSFSSYVQNKQTKQKKQQQLIQLILCRLDVRGWQKEKSTSLTHVRD